jgi:hypothetical protein
MLNLPIFLYPLRLIHNRLIDPRDIEVDPIGVSLDNLALSYGVKYRESLFFFIISDDLCELHPSREKGEDLIIDMSNLFAEDMELDRHRLRY